MRSILFIVAATLLTSCTTTVKRLVLNGVEIGDDRFSAYYQLVDEIVPENSAANDRARPAPQQTELHEAFQLFPANAIKRTIAKGASVPIIDHDVLKTFGQTILLDGKPLLAHPVFEISSANSSPDGTTIAFSCRERPNSPWAVWLVAVDGTNPRLICRGRDPDWLDENTLVYAGLAGGTPSISSQTTNGANERVVHTATSPIRDLSVDRTSGRIAYVTASRPDGSDADVWVYGPGMKQSIRVTENPGRDDAPVWSPDGTTLFFRSTRGGTWGVWFREFANQTVSSHEGKRRLE